ncbi:ACT domain-containing protein ACR11-like protein [Tanacetum coccineum]
MSDEGYRSCPLCAEEMLLTEQQLKHCDICYEIRKQKHSTGRKVDEPELLEAIRLTIISNLLEYHPESSAHLAMGEAFGIEAPKHKTGAMVIRDIRHLLLKL